MQMIIKSSTRSIHSHPVRKLQMNWKHTSGESERFPVGLDNKKEHEAFWFPLDKSCSAQRMRRSCY